MPTAFCTAINCMDGRMQQPVIDYLREHAGVPCVDMITEPGPVRIIDEATDKATLASIRRRLDISVHRHASRTVAVVAHEDCAGNPADRETQCRQARAAAQWVRSLYPGITVLPVWVSLDGQVDAIPEARGADT